MARMHSAQLQASLDDATRLAWQEGRLQVLRESELWTRLGLVDAGPEVQRLYTPVMLAELVRVPVRAVRHWHRKGHLDAERNVGRLPYFNFEQVRVAQRLAELLAAGCSLSQIDRKLDELARLRPDDAAAARRRVGRGRRPPAVCPPRRTAHRAERATADRFRRAARWPTTSDDADAESATIPISSRSIASRPRVRVDFGTDDLRSLADDFEQSGEPDRAIEVYRSILMSGDFTAEDHFSLAELLYRSGDLAAARERYYAAIELDENYVEARANLGCLLAEQGEHALAEAAFRGALEYHPDFADAHFHLARLLDAQNQTREASHHWQRFLDLAPASPWAEEALDRTGANVSTLSPNLSSRAMSEILFKYEQVAPTTWAYLSSLLTIALYFKFSRFWSVRNLDLVILILLAPGLLLVQYGMDQRVDRHATTRLIEHIGYIWLFAVNGCLLLRLLLDAAMVRRPLLEPNLSVGGLTFLGISLYLFLMGNIVTGTPNATDVAGSQRADQLQNLEVVASRARRRSRPTAPVSR